MLQKTNILEGTKVVRRREQLLMMLQCSFFAGHGVERKGDFLLFTRWGECK